MSFEGPFRLQIVKPDGEVLSEDVDECIIPGALGSFGVLKGHRHFIAQVGLGVVTYRQGGREHHLAVEGGFCEVRPDSVILLAERAELADKIDRKAAEQARAAASEELNKIGTMGEADEIERARLKLRRAELKLEVAGKLSAA